MTFKDGRILKNLFVKKKKKKKLLITKKKETVQRNTPANTSMWGPHGFHMGYRGTEWAWAQNGHLIWGPLG